MAKHHLLLGVALLLVPSLSAAQPGPLPFSQFQARWGAGWHAFASPADGTLRFLTAPGVPESRSDALVADVARLAGVDPAELLLRRTASRVDGGRVRELRRFDRFWRGVEVEGDEVLVVVIDGQIGAVWVRLGPIRGLPAPRPGELVRRLPDGRAALARRVVLPGRIEWRDRDGAVVLEEPTWHDDTVTLTREEYAPGDGLVTAPAREVVVRDGGGASEVTDADGATLLTGPFDVTLDGPHITIEEGGSAVRIRDLSDGDLLGGTDLSYEAASVQHHYGVVRDWLASRWDDTSGMDEHTSAAVDDLSLPCNAYYDNISDRFGFSPAVQGCEAMARFGDIVAHEAGHRIHWKLLVGGVYASDVSEGSADYVSATIHDEPEIANGAGGPGVPLRDIERDRVYPDDVFGEPHNDGLVWASFMWDLRQALARDLGDVEGVDAADRIFLGALEQGPGLTELWSAVLVADDDDGTLASGTPHDCLILGLLEEHGLGPDSLGAILLEHQPPVFGPSDATSYPLSFVESTAFPACDGIGTQGVTLRYTTTPDATLPQPGVEDPAWSTVPLVIAGGSFDGELPRVPANTNVRYFVEVTRADARVLISHRGTPDRLWSFWVGDRRNVWCDDLEGDVSGWSSATGLPFRDEVRPGAFNDWEFGAPTGLPGEPDTAHSGTRIVDTWLDGEYLSDNEEQLLTPEVALAGGGVMRLVTLARWLAVEDGLYDHAGVWAARADGTWVSLWSNHETVAGNTHLIDDAWTLQQHDLSPVLAADGTHDGPVQVAFTLETDQGLELSGWAIDDVCIEELAEPERHYRVHDLVVTLDDAGVATLAWSMPWIQPFTAVAIVRKQDAPPAHVSDGARLPAPPREQWVAGTNLTVTDAPPGPGTWHYAVFLAGRGGPNEWYDVAVPGENEGSVTIEGTIDTDPDAGPSDEDAGAGDVDGGDAGGGGDGGESGGCGCRLAGGPASVRDGALGLMALALTLGLRRRRRPIYK